MVLSQFRFCQSSYLIGGVPDRTIKNATANILAGDVPIVRKLKQSLG